MIAKPINRVRLGHAVRVAAEDDHGALVLALKVASGSGALEPREPHESAAVLSAEKILQADPRPVYAFVGLLHPELGTVGLIVSPGWVARCLQGASRCDSGGLAGKLGAFACVTDPEKHLIEISFISPSAEGWLEEFLSELGASYGTDHEYVSGQEPNYTKWRDVRATCIDYGRKNALIDRRLWTWEIRLTGSPGSDEVECLVLSPEMRKRLELLRQQGTDIPETLRILPGSVTPEGVGWFATEEVHAAFLGST
jgi:hypothetical protein